MCRSRTEGFFALPSVLSVTFQQENTVLAMCPDPPRFIPQGLVIVQAILLSEQDSNNTSESLVMWTRIISRNQPQLICMLELNTKKIILSGLIDTGADVTVISQPKWPPDWALTPALGTLSGIGGTSNSLRSMQLIRFEGPKGHITTTRPFMIKAPIFLWGRHILSQWGMRLETNF